MKSGSGAPEGFTLVEIMIVVAIIALLAVISVPGFMRARKRSQATMILNELKVIDGAIALYAVETNKASGDPVLHADYKPYLDKRMPLYRTGTDIFGNAYGPQTVDQLPNVPPATKTMLSDVVDPAFWSPYQ